MSTSIKLEIDCLKLCALLPSLISVVDNADVQVTCKCQNDKKAYQQEVPAAELFISPSTFGFEDEKGDDSPRVPGPVMSNDLFPPPPVVEPVPEPLENLNESDKENGDEVENVLVERVSMSMREFYIEPPEYAQGIGKGGVPVTIVQHRNIRHKRISLMTSWDLNEDLEAANYYLFAILEDLVLVNGDDVTITAVNPNEAPNTVRHGALVHANNDEIMRQIVVYAQPIRVQAKLREMHQEMQKEYRTFEKVPPGSTLVPGSAIVSHYEGQWYRAVVLKEAAGDFLIRFVDFGNEELRQFSDLRVIQPKFLILPILAQRCYLKNAMHLPCPLSKDRYARIVEQLLDIDCTLYVKQRHIEGEGEANTDSHVVGTLCELGTTNPLRLLPDLVLEQPSTEIEAEPASTPVAPQLNLLGVAKKIDSRRTNWLRDEAQFQRLQIRPPAMYEMSTFVDPHRFYLKSTLWEVEQKAKVLRQKLNRAFRENSSTGYKARQLYRVCPIANWLYGDVAVAKCTLGPRDTQNTLFRATHAVHVNNDDNEDKKLPVAANEFWRVRLCTLPATLSGLMVEEQLVMCYFIDMGINKNVRVGDLFYMPEMQDIYTSMIPIDHFDEIINTPPLALQCKLARVKPPGGSSQWPSSSLEFVQNECLGKTRVIVGVDAARRVDNPDFPGEDLWLVDIILTYKDPHGLPTYMDFSQLLTESGYALLDNKDGEGMETCNVPQIGLQFNRAVHQVGKKPVALEVDMPPPPQLPVCRWPDFISMPPKEGLPVLVKSVDSNLTFYCIHRNYEPQYPKDWQSMSQSLGTLVAEFHRISPDGANSTLSPGMHCIFKTTSSHFGRGIVNSTKNLFRIGVFAIDSGNVDFFKSSDVFSLDDVVCALSLSMEVDTAVQDALKHCLTTEPQVIAGRLENLHPINPTNPNDLHWEEWSFEAWKLAKKMVLDRKDILMSVCDVFPPRGNADLVHTQEPASDAYVNKMQEERLCLPQFETMLSIRLVSPSFHSDVDMHELGDLLANDEALAYRYDKSNPDEVWLRTPTLFGVYPNPILATAMENCLYPVFVPHVATPTEVFLHFETSHASFPRLPGDDPFYGRLLQANAFLVRHEETSKAMAAGQNLDLQLALLGDGACSAKSPDDGRWYRALIRHVRDILPIVQFVDFGDRHAVQKSDIHEAKFTEIPVACVKVKLFGVRRHPVRGEKVTKEDLLNVVREAFRPALSQIMWCRFRKVYNDGRLPLVELFRDMDCQHYLGEELFTENGPLELVLS